MGGPHRLEGDDRAVEPTEALDAGGVRPRGPADDLSDWVEATAPRAVAFAVSLLHNRERAEDVVQTCYCRLLARKDAYDLRADGLKILLAAVANACVNLKTRRRGFFSLFDAEGRTRDLPDPSTPPPDGALLGRELAEAIDRALRTLPVRHRAAIELKSQGCSLREIAEALGVGESNAGVLVHRARAAMEAALAPYLGGPEP
ncbi:RNA polymerase sigma factor [Paludisphaera rhizosphaerae]|uniref:RNA polymerase sigma factor n=1 Tax=Paludisphaera rhizosphaerae TaxID=2711216 RepID=UPI0013E99F58|nr:RNA polymerase sigma factor [Paludisphaera rhizosphaerae]